ncbi:MAG: alanine racemase, partial [Eubacteriales bacterium]|nr:alanine racemase [Eubacteriales bacterium]
MEPSKHRIWAEIDLDTIEHNYRVICAQAKSPVLCVVKADAYGHGAIPVAVRLQKAGAPYFAAATV